jgi:hypothetical protein
MATLTTPPHVDPARMLHCELFDRKIVYDNPYETIIPAIHRGGSVCLNSLAVSLSGSPARFMPLREAAGGSISRRGSGS